MKRKEKYVQLEFGFKPWDDEEIWKDIPNYEGLYQASNLGRVRSLDRWVDGKNGIKYFVKGMILKPRLSNIGYQQVFLRNNGNRKNCYIHRLVWEAFNGKIPEGMEINHISENKQENKLSNLNLLSHSANLNWGTRNERAAKTRSKPVIQKSLQGEIIRIWPSASEVERKLGYSKGNISNCCNGIKHFNTAYNYIWEYEEAV